ncbi:ribonuclease H1-like [Leptopilina boulardi]|uniref:ribonuclease H1-like n=1 Tax=Leptopilina boulardi TaxID=63433 RepID=UPI0021F58A8B|nr:ribonuclease H1-like [Leptopilina boulardi]
MKQTNNGAEIEAIVKTISILKKRGLRKVRINTDSKFAIDGYLNWLPKWNKNGWKTNRRKTVVSKEIFNKLSDNITGIKVELIYEPGHSGIKGNEEADSLAKIAIE